MIMGLVYTKLISDKIGGSLSSSLEVGNHIWYSTAWVQNFNSTQLPNLVSSYLAEAIFWRWTACIQILPLPYPRVDFLIPVPHLPRLQNEYDSTQLRVVERLNQLIQSTYNSTQYLKNKCSSVSYNYQTMPTPAQKAHSITILLCSRLFTVKLCGTVLKTETVC